MLIKGKKGKNKYTHVS